MAKVSSRIVYTTSDGKDFDYHSAAKRHERKIAIMNYLVDNQKNLGTGELGLTERQAELVIDLLTDNIGVIHGLLNRDDLI